MKKWEKKDYKYVSLLIILFLALVFFLTKDGYLYGSKTDWLTQHVTIPEYLRNLFYQTKQLFPNLAPHLGGGVNIYYLSYYGLFSPIIMFSYLLPSVDMLTYIQISSIIIIILSIILFYHFIRKKYDSKVSFISTLVFITACPIIFHSHRHLMFINYMPFLLLSLHGVERYFDNKKSGLLIISTFLMIMCSYFYSVGGLLCISIYAIYYDMTKKRLSLLEFIKDGIKFCLPILTSILMSMILLLPTLFVILNGRNDTNVTIDLASLILPNFQAKYLLYKTYGMGLTSIFIVTIADNLLRKDNKKTFLACTFLLLIIFPIFVYILNGGMYLDAKVLIPLIPLACLMIADTIDRFYQNKTSFNLIIVSMAFGFIILIFNHVKTIPFIIDISLLLMTLLFKNKKWLFNTVLIGTVIINCLTANLKDNLVVKDELYLNPEFHDSIIKNNRNYRINDTTDQLFRINKVYHFDDYKTSIYSSTVPLGYQNFYFHTFNNANPNRNLSMMGENKNIFFQYYMAGRYLIDSEASLIGYNKLNDTLYENTDVYPLGYVNHQMMSKEQFDNLSYPDNIEALLKYSIVDKAKTVSFKSHMEKLNMKYTLQNKHRLEINNDGLKKIIRSNGMGYMNVHLDNSKYKIIILKFRLLKDQSCKKGDMGITINGIRNVLTCHSWKYHNHNFVFNYVISSNQPITDLRVDFMDGVYKIADEEVYGFNYKYLKNLSNDVDKLNIDYDLSKGDNIVGDIDVTFDGYFQMSIPYDEGFKVQVDGLNQKIEKVDTAFIGFPISKGHHEIKIKYEALMKKEAIIYSVSGVFLLFIQLIVQKVRSKKV